MRVIHYLPPLAIILGLAFLTFGMAQATVMRSLMWVGFEAWVESAWITLVIGAVLIALGVLARWRGV